MKTMVCNFVSFGGNRLRAFGAALILVGLVACGGGGGGGSTTPTPNPPVVVNPPAKPTLGTLAFAVPSGTTLEKGAAVQVQVNNLTGSITSLKTSDVTTCNSVKATLTTAAFTTSGTTATSSITLPGEAGQSCVTQLSVVASGPDGDSAPATATLAWTVKGITCAAPRVYDTAIKQCAYPMDVKVTGTLWQQLPTGCTSVYKTVGVPSSGFSTCWSDFVAADKVVWIQSSAKMDGLLKTDGTADPRATRSMIYAGFTGSTGKMQILQFYADTGELFNTASDIDAQWIGEGINSVTGNSSGYLLKTTSPVQCMQWRWQAAPNNVWGNASLTCSS